jgi:predicted O-methyltransferase YrrM
VRRILDLHGCQDVVLVKGDATKIDEDRLSPAYSVILVDVDLSVPTYAVLTKFYSRLAKGGIILVDDCSEEPEQIWRAIIGYKQFCAEHRLSVRFEYGQGVIEKE